MRPLLVLLMMLALAFAGCTDAADDDDHGDDDATAEDSDTGDGDTEGDDGDAGSAMPAGESEPKTHHVSIEGSKFSPDTLSITQGDTVVWTNNDGFAHTVDSTDGTTTLDSGNIAGGETFSFTFDDAGTFAYRCDIHTSMTGEIEVASLAAS